MATRQTDSSRDTQEDAPSRVGCERKMGAQGAAMQERHKRMRVPRLRDM
jgi:hypothetical protein